MLPGTFYVYHVMLPGTFYAQLYLNIIKKRRNQGVMITIQMVLNNFGPILSNLKSNKYLLYTSY